MSDPIEFFFEYVSPYAFIAAKQIEEVGACHGREVIWRPVSLGHIWKTVEATNVGPGAIPQKAEYIMMDSGRSARIAGYRMTAPAVFPTDAKLARLAFYVISAKDKELAKNFADGVFDKYWTKSEEITEISHLTDLTDSLGIVAADMEAAASDPNAKAAMIESTDAALKSGAFGMPWFRVGDQVFWGADRVSHIDKYLEFKARQV
ncbi:MAG: DsbA family protein [Sneathiella sp.]|nr:DsbA family protein [Sneathiella sp.]